MSSHSSISYFLCEKVGLRLKITNKKTAIYILLLKIV